MLRRRQLKKASRPVFQGVVERAEGLGLWLERHCAQSPFSPTWIPGIGLCPIQIMHGCPPHYDKKGRMLLAEIKDLLDSRGFLAVFDGEEFVREVPWAFVVCPFRFRVGF